MKVSLLHVTPLIEAIKAIRKCWKSEDRMDSVYSHLSGATILGPNDERLIRMIIGHGHTSTLEHVVFNFEIDGVSRALLQEHARHRIASPSVQSTRYTLQKLVNRDTLVEDLLVQTGDKFVDALNRQQLAMLREHITDLKEAGKPINNDKLKFALPEAFKTTMIWSINARSLRNYLKLRSSPRAMWEIRELAGHIMEHIPGEHRVLFDDLCIN